MSLKSVEITQDFIDSVKSVRDDYVVMLPDCNERYKIEEFIKECELKLKGKNKDAGVSKKT